LGAIIIHYNTLSHTFSSVSRVTHATHHTTPRAFVRAFLRARTPSILFGHVVDNATPSIARASRHHRRASPARATSTHTKPFVSIIPHAIDRAPRVAHPSRAVRTPTDGSAIDRARRRRPIERCTDE